MDPDRSGPRAFTTPSAAVSCNGSSSESDEDEDFSLSPGCNVSDEYSCTDALQIYFQIRMILVPSRATHLYR
jgi:hypothetical protein